MLLEKSFFESSNGLTEKISFYRVSCFYAAKYWGSRYIKRKKHFFYNILFLYKIWYAVSKYI
jgi:hypothetical protein